LKEEAELSTITLEEVRMLQKFVKEKSGTVTEELGKGKSDEIDIHDFVNVMMDVSLDMLGKEEAPPQITDSFFY
jgi:hypothetical protein